MNKHMKLNALFAEKVLGWHVSYYEKDNVWFWYPKTTREWCHFPKGEQFTSSLDAVWIGVRKLAEEGWCCRELKADYNYVYNVIFRNEDTHDNPIHAQSEIHPAYALVKACLLAVGVTQKEINDAEHYDRLIIVKEKQNG